ncbi:MAG: hypothetical protein ACJAUP_001912 [Cellvibrionaceae bacterium]
MAKDSRRKNDSDGVIYKHKIVIIIKADYSGLIQYLKQIESLGWGLFMQDIHYKIEQYPNAHVSFILYFVFAEGE